MNTRERIRDAAWKMVREGIWPTQTPVLDRIGNVGSKRTVTEELRAWTAEALSLLASAREREQDQGSQDGGSGDVARIRQLEDENIKVQAMLDESRANLRMAYDRFEKFEDRMLMEVDKAREESKPVIEKLKKELQILRADAAMQEEKLIRQNNTLSKRLRDLGADGDA